MRILVTGATGQLGYDVCHELDRRGVEYVGIGSKDCDISDREAVQALFDRVQPDALMHLAAYTKVDAAEEDAMRCWDVNVSGTANLASCCGARELPMMYISTDYVFPGTGEHFYLPEDPVGPAGNYGRTKLAGELAVQAMTKKHFIVRISWVFGVNGSNFIKTILRLSESRDTLRVVADQIGSPTATDDLAPVLCDMIATDRYGVYHATNEGTCSWAELAEFTVRRAGRNTKIIPVTSEEYGAKAVRPKNSRMSKDRLEQAGFARLPDWHTAAARYIDSLL